MATPRKQPRKPHKAASSTTPQMGDAQKKIYSKLKRRGMSEKQATSFSHHAAKRKEAAAKRGGHKTSSSKPIARKKGKK